MVQINGENALIEPTTCFICNGTKFDRHTSDYQRCKSCGHETLLESQSQGFIINDDLSESEIRRISRLDLFKANTLSKFDREIDKNHLLDIGSASGKFLHHNSNRYTRSTGIEITPKSQDFSRNVLGLDIMDSMQDAPNNISIVTAWHSLEHIPTEKLLEILNELPSKMIDNGRLIISVPNGASWQYKLFGKAYAFFDVPNHLHQFTPESLEKLLQKFDFYHIETVNSWPYNTFGYTQSIINFITRTHNYLYYRLKRRSCKPSILLDIVNGLLLPIVIPIGWILGVVDSMNLKRQGVITSCFEKRTC